MSKASGLLLNNRWTSHGLKPCFTQALQDFLKMLQGMLLAVNKA